MRVAAFDLGSNSFHLLVVDASADGHFVPLARDKETLRLGDMVSREGRITEAGMARAIDTIARFKNQADGLGAVELMACATSAIRDADNGGEVIDAIYAATGVRVGVLSGIEEARLIFQAVRASVVIDPGPALCLDLGGGSLEVMVGGPEGLLRAATLPLGVGRLTTELVRNDPPSGDDARRLRERITATLAPVAEEMASLRPTMTVATSGTFSDLARMALARRTGAVPASLNQVTVTREEVEDLHADIMAATVAQRTKMAGLDARRADQMPAGSMVAVVAMELFGISELTMSAWALREGIVLEEIGRADPALWTSDAHLIRRSSVLGLARRCSWDEAHSRHVTRLALALFDATVSLHGFGPDERELLDHASLLHDIGTHVA
ncbi:MAG TPA: Ppx/GppA phosphatase family protein, partial [Acidimicrobiales bacterium]